MNAQVRSSTVPRQRLCDALRMLSIDAVEAAKSGHPGMPMGMAEIAEVLWRGYLKHNPADPHWPDRDRFVLSNGHGSMLLYALLHLSGYALPLEELKRFRQLHSKTPGHPEVGVTPGVETTTGPLGQGLANAVGMALAEQLLAAEFNRPGHTHRRSPHLGVRRRWLPDGGHQPRGVLAGRHPRAVQADRHLRRQRHQHRRPRRALVRRRHAGTLRGLRLARDPRRGRPRPAADRGRPCAGRRRTAGARPWCAARPSSARAAPTRQARTTCTAAALGAAEVAATRAALGWTASAFEIPEDVRSAWDARAGGAAAQAAVAAPLRRLRPGTSAAGRRVPSGASWHARCRRTGGARSGAAAAERRTGRARRRLAQGLAECHRGTAAAAAGAAGRLGGPHRLEPHRRPCQRAGAPRQLGQLHQLRRARVRHERRS